MAKKKRGSAHTGGHGWFATFADLMGLMMSFFVMLVAFSSMDNNKLKIVAGSMRDAFGTQSNVRYSGIIESDGLPTRPKLRNVDHIAPEDSSPNPTPDDKDRGQVNGARLQIDREFALASASLRQALQDMPELTEMSKHIMFEEISQGLNLEIVDQDGRSMFADGSKVPYERTRRLIQKLAPPLKATPLRVSIIGHTAAGFVPARSEYDAFDLSADRANAVRDDYADARRSAASARLEAVIRREISWSRSPRRDKTRLRRAPWCYGCPLTVLAEASIAAPDQISR